MARIIYGVQGEGRGHSSRSKIIIEHLLDQGHEVRILTSQKGYAYLSQFYDDVTAIMGLKFVFDGDQLDVLKTLQKNLQDGSTDAGKTLKALFSGIKSFDPHLAITDFEPFVPYAKTLYNLPFISINHQHVISHYHLEYPYRWRGDYLKARAVVDNMYWFADHYYVTSFFFPEVRRRFRRRSSLVGPILRREVLRQKRAKGDHILIYATTPESRRALELAQEMKAPCVAYGFEEPAGRRGNITFKKPSTRGFLRDAAEARAIITNGGYTLMSEALYLGKPVYSIPIGSQFEQMMNGYYLEKLGYGLFDLEPRRERLRMFLDGLAYFRKNIRRDRDRFCSNQELFAELDRLIADLNR